MGNNEAKLKIVIEAQNRATQELTKLVGELQKMHTTTEKAGGSQKTLMQTLGGLKTSALAAAAGVTAFAVAVKKGYDFAQEGASISRLEDATTNLAASMGGNMDEIVSAMRKASSGTISNLSIMQTAGRAMMYGLGSNAEKMSNLMQIAMFRGRAMGLSGEQAFSDIVTGIGRLSPMILDNLGIVLNSEQTFKEYAATIGKTGDSLSSAEKRQAMLNKVLEEGNKMMQAAGGLADDAATPYERLSTALQNIGNSFKQGLGEALAPAATAIADAITYTDRLKAEFEGMGSSVARSSLYYSQYEQILRKNATAAGLVVTKSGDLVRVTMHGTQVVEEIIQKNYLWSESLYNVMIAIDNVPDDSFVEKARRMATATDDIKYSMDELQTVMRGEVGKETERFGKAQQDNADAIKETEKELAKLGVNPYATPEQLRQIDDLNRKLYQASYQLREMEKGAGVSRGGFGAKAGLADEMRGNGIDEETIAKVSGLNVEIGTLYQKITDLGGKPFLTEEQRAQIDELKGKLSELQGQQTSNTDEHNRNMKEMIFNMSQQQIAASDMTEEEQQKATIALAENLGLVDEETAKLWEQTQSWVGEIAGASKEAQTLGKDIEDIPSFKKVIIEIEAVGDKGILDFLNNTPKPTGRKGGDDPQASFATGGSFVVGGSGGIDSQVVAFNATPGEHVNITPAGKKGGRAGSGVNLKNYGTIIVGSMEELGMNQYGGRL